MHTTIESWLQEHFKGPVVRDGAAVSKSIAEVEEQWITKTGCFIYIPKRFEEAGMAEIGEYSRIACIYMMVVGGNYSIVNRCTMMHITPDTVSVVNINGDEYYEFGFNKGAVVTPNVNLVKNDTFTYNIYNELIAKGRVPLYLRYEDLSKVLLTAPYHAGLTFAPTNAVMEMVTAAITRDPKNYTRYYRAVSKGSADQVANPPAFIGLRNIQYGATNTTSKLMGSYLEIGVRSALVSPSTENEGVEDILRA